MHVVHAERTWVVIDKPPLLPSVPTRAARTNPADHPSVESLIPDLFPHAAGPLIVHRLDHETSGLMVVALTRRAHRSLSRQFMQRKVGKSYTALVTARIDRDEGSVDLPLAVDWPNRPRQCVDFATGRPARTLYRVVDRTPDHTRLDFRPLTGRTHQLRVHAATPRCVDACMTERDDYDSKVHRCGWPSRGGLGAPIIGDALYGAPTAPRLMLHAHALAFFNPDNGAWRTFTSPAPF